MQTGPETGDVAPRGRGGGRWRRSLHRIARVILGLAIVAAAAGAAVQGVLLSDVPRRLVQSSLARATGLEVRIGTVEIGWLGESVLRDVTVGVPPGGPAMATAPTIRARHSWLPAVLLTGDPGLGSLHLEGVDIQVVQGPGGEWNVVRALELIKGAQPTGSSSQSRLPEVRIAGSVTLSPRGRPPVELPLTLAGHGSGPWEFEGALGGITAKGAVSASGWSHRATITARGVDPLIAVWIDDAPPDIGVEARWDGRWTRGRLEGVLELRSLVAGTVSAAGLAKVSADGTGLQATPLNLEMHDSRWPGRGITLAEGTAWLRPGGIGARGVRLSGENHQAQIDAAWDPSLRTGSFSASWDGAAVPPGLGHDGSISLTAKVPAAGRWRIEGLVRSTGWSDAGRWMAAASVNATGLAWISLEGDIAFAELILTREGAQPLSLSGTSASVTADWPRVRLEGLAVPGVEGLRASGGLDASTHEWSINVDAPRWTAPGMDEPLAVSVRASGDDSRLDFSSLHASYAGAEVRAEGSYEPGREHPLLASARVSAPLPERLALDPEAPGRVEGVLDLSGTWSPRRLLARGRLRVPEIRASAGATPAVEVSTRATLDARGLEAIVEPFELFGGTLAASASTNAEGGRLRAGVEMEGLELNPLIALFIPGVEVEGTLTASVAADSPSLDPARASVDGDWQITGARTAGWGAANGTGKFRFREGRVRVDELNLVRGEGWVTGSIDFEAAHPGRLRLDLSAHGWRAGLNSLPLAATIDGTLAADLDLAARTAAGDFDLRFDSDWEQRPIGPVRVAGTIDGRAVRAATISAEVLGGRVQGAGELPLDQWTMARADLSLQSLDLELLDDYTPLAADSTGIISGRLTAGPSESPRALEPLHARADLQFEAGSIRGMPVEELRLSAFAGPGRLILDSARAGFAGGSLNAWARLTAHDGEPFLHASLDGSDLSLQQLVRAADPLSPDMPGVIGLRADFGGYVRQPHRGFGEAIITVDRADLAAVPLVTQLYGLLNLKNPGGTPEGRGTAHARLEGDALLVSRAQYFNRGTDVIASGRIEDVWAGADSPVRGVAVAASRPLRELSLPFVREIDRAFLAATRGAVTVRIDGTVGAPDTRTVPASEIGGLIRRALGREAEEAQNPSDRR